MKYFKFKIFIVFIILITPISTLAQLEWNNWIVKEIINSNSDNYFSKNLNNFYIYNFQDKNQLFLKDSFKLNYTTKDWFKSSYEISTISNKKNGELLFFTNGWEIYNSKFEIIKNGVLKVNSEEYSIPYSHPCITKKSLILPSSIDIDKYAVFYFSKKNNKNGLFYNLVDKKLDNGKGEVYSLNNFLEEYSTELEAIYHKNNINKWVITYKYSTNEICLFNFDGDFNLVGKRVFKVLDIFKIDQKDLNIKIEMSPKGDLLALAFYPLDSNYGNWDKTSNIYIFEFNNANGDLKLKKILNTPANSILSISFSENGKYLYGHYYDIIESVNSFDNYKLFRYDCINFDKEIIKINGFLNDAETNIYHVNSDELEIGLDGDLYLNSLENGNVFRISNSEYKKEFLNIEILYQSTFHYLFPNTFPLYPPIYDIKLYTNAPICINSDTLKLFSTLSHYELPDTIYEWTTPTGEIFNSEFIFIPKPNMSNFGRYYFRVKSKVLDVVMLDSIDIILSQAQDFEILAEGKFCVGEVVKLSSDKNFAEYLWSNGETTKEISVTSSGTYNLIVTDENGCTNEKSIDVEFISPREYKLDFTDYDFGNVEIDTEKRVKVNLPKDVGIIVYGDFIIDMLNMEIIFKPDTERDNNGEIVLNYGGDCDTSVTIIFKGRGVNSVKYLAKIIAPKVATEAGLDNVELPIKFEINDENIVYPFELDYKIKLSLNYDVYIPQIPSTINGIKREIEIAGKTQINKGENIINIIKGKTYLSQNMENEIEIMSFEHKTHRLTVENEDGYLNITDVCLPELRGLILFTPTKMSVSPNPVSSDLTIKINTEEKGNHKLRLIDITGNSREIGEFTINELTEKVLKINAKDFAKGQYFLELLTPNQTLVEKVVVE